MNLSLGVQTLQLVAWLFALIETILAFYVLVLNARHPANRHLSVLVLSLAINAAALGFLIGAETPEQALLPTYLLAATLYSVLPAVAIVTMVLLRPAWLRGRWRWGWRMLYVLVFLVPILTLVDVTLGTQVWYVGFNAVDYAGGYIPLREYVSAALYGPATVIFAYVLGLAPFIPIISTLADKKVTLATRKVAWLLLSAQLVGLIVQGGGRTLAGPVIRVLIVTGVIVITYVYAAFQQTLSERRLQRGQLRSRLTLMFLAITIPVLVVSVLLIGSRARALLIRTETARLGAIAHLVTDAVGLEPTAGDAYLAVLARLAQAEVGDTGVVYIVDAEDRIVVHSVLPFTSLVAEDDPVRDFSLQVPVASLRAGKGDDLVVFTDADGVRWWSYSTELKMTGWGIVVQQQEAVLAEVMQRFMSLSWVVVVVGVILLSVLSFLTVRQAFSPIVSLTETARAIADGDLARVATVDSEDEIGALAQAFNSVTARLNDLIGGLEARVAERTEDVERRAEYLAITGGVSRVAASILDVDTLLDRVVHLITERFDFYHAGIFLIDDAREWAELRAASSEGGLRMLARAHRLRVGEQGIVGYVSGTGRPRVALDVDEDVVWVQNPDLPETRSEMALPMIIGERVIGVLDVQSEAAEAFGTEDVTTLRILADQIAVAIRNAQLFGENQRTLRELQRVYGAEVRQGWATRPSSVVGYRYTPAAVNPLTSVDDTSIIETEGAYVGADNTLYVPMQLAGTQTFGYLRLQRAETQPWTQQEIAFVSTAVQDVAQALEVSRLLEQSRRRVANEQMITQVASRVRQELYVEDVLRTAGEQVQQVLGLGRIAIQMVPPEKVGAVGGQDDA